jgi:hypothetical protein
MSNVEAIVSRAYAQLEQYDNARVNRERSARIIGKRQRRAAARSAAMLDVYGDGNAGNAAERTYDVGAASAARAAARRALKADKRKPTPVAATLPDGRTIKYRSFNEGAICQGVHAQEIKYAIIYRRPVNGVTWRRCIL